MICWAVTGPMGAGKSTFSKALVARGAVLIDADLLGHQALENTTVIEKLTACFGEKILSSGKVSRPALGEIVFNDNHALQQLNAITHPHISQLAREIIKSLTLENSHALAVFEAAVYFLLPEPPECNLVISVLTRDDFRIRRIMASRGLTLPETQARLDSQISLEKHWESADVLVHNDGTQEELEIEAHRLMQEHGLIAGDDDPRRELSS